MLPRNKIPGKWSTKSFDHANIVKGMAMIAPDSITQFCGTQVSPNTAEAYGFRSQDAIASQNA
jgi:hypothetical protein